MRAYSLIAPAKINLYLKILGDRADGYHELVMILQSLELGDQVQVRANGIEKIRIYCDHPEVPLDQTNLAHRAAQLMVQQFPEAYANYGGVDIHIEKNIPVAAGLAGGSTDAAAVLVGLDLMWQLGLTYPELEAIAENLGSDVPFCLAGGSAIATGRGEKLDPITNSPCLFVVLAKYRNIGVSTLWAYQTYRQEFSHGYINDPDRMKTQSSKISSSPLVQAITRSNGEEIGKLMHNDLEKIVLPEYPKVAQLRETFARTGVLGTMMSGSGSTVFALCESAPEAERVRDEVRNAIPDPNLEFWITRFSSQGVRVSLTTNG